jgi:hypothetical protein
MQFIISPEMIDSLVVVAGMATYPHDVIKNKGGSLFQSILCSVFRNYMLRK